MQVTTEPGADSELRLNRKLKNAALQPAYRRWRPTAECAVVWLVAGGNRRPRYRGALPNNGAAALVCAPSWPRSELHRRAARRRSERRMNAAVFPLTSRWRLIGDLDTGRSHLLIALGPRQR